MTVFPHHPYRLGMVCLLLVMSCGLFITSKMLREAPTIKANPTVTRPGDVVRGWAKTFPHAPLLAASLTTAHFRDGRSTHEWIHDVREVWPDLRFQYRTGQMQSGWTKSHTALILFRTTSSSIWGEHERQEEYRLIKTTQGRWLINEMRLVREQIL